MGTDVEKAKALADATAAVVKTNLAIVATKAEEKKDDCTKAANKDNTACKAHAATLLKEEATLKTEEATLKTEEATLKKAEGGGATVGIIIACVAVVLCVGGGAAWYIKHKKSAEEFDDVYSSM